MIKAVNNSSLYVTPVHSFSIFLSIVLPSTIVIFSGHFVLFFFFFYIIKDSAINNSLVWLIVSTCLHLPSPSWRCFPEHGHQVKPVYISHSVWNYTNSSSLSFKPKMLYLHRELCSMSCGSLNGRGVLGEWIHVCVWLSSFAVHLKLSQHC